MWITAPNGASPSAVPCGIATSSVRTGSTLQHCVLRQIQPATVPGLTAGVTSHGEGVGADSKHARLPLDAGNGLKQLLPPAGIAPARIELREQPARAFHGQQIGEDG